MKNNTTDLIKKYCKDIEELLLAKNKKYGDSAINPLRIFSKADPVEQIYVRLDDKLSRISRGDPNLEDEDVITDLIGYLILLQVARSQQK